MPDPRCPFCRRRYADPRGCKPGLPGEIDPVLYGEEVHPISSSPTCADCGAGTGAIHHVACSCAECPNCRELFHGSMSCDENRQLTMGGAA
jgi:hypothetical protein